MTFSLFSAGLFTFIFGFMLLRQYLSLRTSFLLMFAKVSIPIVYFSQYENLFTPYDDTGFQRGGIGLLNEGITPWNFIFNIDFVIDYFDSTNITPYLVSMLGQSLFGPHYFSPVFINIILTILTGIYFVFILSRTGFSSNYYNYFLIFFVIHWEIITYSSIINVKEILITLFITMYIYHNIMAVTSRELIPSAYHTAVMGIILPIMYLSRFYIIPILVLTSIIWMIIEKEHKWWQALPAVGLYPVIQKGLQVDSSKYFDFELLQMIKGFLRILLTPQPWNINPQFEFLTVSSLLHWLLFIPAIAYSSRLFLRHKNLRLLLYYFVLMIGFYTVFYNLTSARMRYQIIIVFALGQYHFLWSLSQAIKLDQLSNLTRVMSTK